MSTTPAETTPAETTPETETPAFDVSTLDDFGRQLVAKMTALITDRNSLAQRIKAAGGDLETLVDEIAESDDDERIVKVRSAVEALQAKLEEAETALRTYAKEIAEARIASNGEDVTVLNTQCDEFDGKIRKGIAYLKEEHGAAAATVLPALVGRKGRSNPGKSGSDSASGQKRIRGVDVYVDGKHAVSKDAKGVERSNFSAAAKLAGVVTRALQDAYWAAAGTQDVNSLPDNHTVTFSITDPEGTAHDVSVTKMSAENTAQPGE